MKAILQSPLANLTVNRETRVVSGVKLLENNRDVSYKGADGKAMGFRTNSALLNGLIGHAGNRTIPSHLSHEWSDGKREALFDRVGGIKNCRLSDSGDLIGDAHVMPGEKGDSILWLAENDPEHCALSCIFDYNALKTDGVTYAYPLSFESADFVAKGAGVTALLTASTTDTDMTKEEIQAIVTDSIKAALADFKPAIPAALSKEDVSGIVKASLAEFKPELSEAQLADLSAKAEASFTAKLGSGPLQVHIGDAKRGSDYTAKLAEYRKTSPNSATANARLLKDHPEFSQIHEESLALQVAKLSGQSA